MERGRERSRRLSGVVWLSEEARMADALAIRGDEGRANLRKARSETSQYPEEKKSTEILQVVANERGRAQNLCM